MEFGLNITVDDDATPQEIAEALCYAALHAAGAISNRERLIAVDGQIDCDVVKDKLQNATVNRYA